MFVIVPNDGAMIPKTLYKDGQSFVLSSSADVKAALLSRDHSKLLAGPVALGSTTTGSDWDNSLVVAKFSAQDLAGLTENAHVVLEIQVIDGGMTQTWFDEGEVRIGHIA